MMSGTAAVAISLMKIHGSRKRVWIWLAALFAVLVSPALDTCSSWATLITGIFPEGSPVIDLTGIVAYPFISIAGYGLCTVLAAMALSRARSLYGRVMFNIN
jgi:hypothetical protein